MSEKNPRIQVLTFGHLPISIGGKQSSGLSIGIWNIANTINSINDQIVYSIAATDVNWKKQKLNNTIVYGWSYKLLLKDIFRHFFRSAIFFYQSLLLKLNFRLPFFNSFAKIIFFDNIINQINPDFIHFHDFINFIICSNIKSTTKINKIITLHGIFGDDQISSYYIYYRKMEEITTKSDFKQIIFISSHVQKQWKELYGELSVNNLTIFPGINLEAFNYSDNLDPIRSTGHSSKLTLCTVGSICERKGQYRVIQAIGCLPTKEKFHYLCIGNGKASVIKKLIKEANELNVSIEIIGNITQHELKEHLICCDYMILPSSSEGFGAVYLESIACGTPVIIPITLPLSNEPNILNKGNSVFIRDHSTKSIIECLSDLDIFPYSRFFVSNSIDFNIFSWKYGCLQYIKIINSLRKSEL